MEQKNKEQKVNELTEVLIDILTPTKIQEKKYSKQELEDIEKAFNDDMKWDAELDRRAEEEPFEEDNTRY